MPETTKPKPTLEELKERAESAALKLYENVLNTKWEEMALEYYDSVRGWARVKHQKDKEMKTKFEHVKVENTDLNKLDLWKDLITLWIKNPNNKILIDPEKDAFVKEVLEADSDKATEIARRLLIKYVGAAPVIDETVENAEHYKHFSDMIKLMAEGEIYHANDHAWWLVYDVLYKTWLKKKGEGVQEEELEPEEKEALSEPPPPMPPPIPPAEKESEPPPLMPEAHLSEKAEQKATSDKETIDVEAEVREIIEGTHSDKT